MYLVMKMHENSNTLQSIWSNAKLLQLQITCMAYTVDCSPPPLHTHTHVINWKIPLTAKKYYPEISVQCLEIYALFVALHAACIA